MRKSLSDTSWRSLFSRMSHRKQVTLYLHVRSAPLHTKLFGKMPYLILSLDPQYFSGPSIEERYKQASKRRYRTRGESRVMDEERALLDRKLRAGMLESRYKAAVRLYRRGVAQCAESFREREGSLRADLCGEGYRD
jgi:hypothetical protein